MSQQTATASGSRPPGMTDVAELAGVSAQTVSRVLSGHPNVKEKTKVAVLAAVDQLGYRLNSAARTLSSGRSRTLGVVSLATVNYSGAVMAYGIESAARAAGYTVSTATTASLDAPAIASAMARLVEQAVEGIVLAVPVLSANDDVEALSRRIPTVTIDGSRTESAEVVELDQVAAARLATEHLLELGHQTVWHLAGPLEWLDAASRAHGWRETLENAGRSVPPELHGDWSPESGYQAGLLIGRMPEVTAVFVASDEMAFGVIRALHELGRRVPEDVSIVGFDDIALAAYCSPALTTIAQPFDEIGRRAVAHVLRRIEDPSAAAEPESVSPQLVVRGSTAPPATA